MKPVARSAMLLFFPAGSGLFRLLCTIRSRCTGSVVFDGQVWQLARDVVGLVQGAHRIRPGPFAAIQQHRPEALDDGGERDVVGGHPALAAHRVHRGQRNTHDAVAAHRNRLRPPTMSAPPTRCCRPGCLVTAEADSSASNQPRFRAGAGSSSGTGGSAKNPPSASSQSRVNRCTAGMAPASWWCTFTRTVHVPVRPSITQHSDGGRSDSSGRSSAWAIARERSASSPRWGTATRRR